ncbi:unnamed protein product [Nesidiocoris tenuis]|uniref:Palmitoyltransferase n=2 Tax=Nesidiocoris tenuis TaxID=355587 RepID=A0A6H5HRP9_9HEMI|nr:DHHC palmitoyltransferase [Nesidiocoris tenuis]CAB0019260.1 unnamed protein product [Nesidiocoris tenuis]
MTEWCSASEGGTAAPEHRKWRRLHGLQPPLHPQQLLGWALLLLFGGASFVLLIPSVTPSLWPPLFAVLVSLYAVHAVAHVTALLLDPADPELRKLKATSLTVPEFDRSKHAHVIENGRCHLCNIRTSGPRTKHCSVCNKCVGRFDHHCKWLNHCIGGRNYVAFIVCVVSAVLACLVIVGLSVAILVLYHVDRSWLCIWYNNDDVGDDDDRNDHTVNYLALNDNVFLFVTAVVGTLAAIAAGLLTHLCLFHAYISYLGITTYEYIRNYRQMAASSSNRNVTTSSSSTVATALQPSSTDTIFTVQEHNRQQDGKLVNCVKINERVKTSDGRTCCRMFRRSKPDPPPEEKFEPAKSEEKTTVYHQIGSLKRNHSFTVDNNKLYLNGAGRPLVNRQQVVRKTCLGCRYCQMLKADPTLKDQIDAYKRKSARRKMKRREGTWFTRHLCSNVAESESRATKRNQVRPSRSMPSSFSAGSISSSGVVVVKSRQQQRSSSLTSLPSLPPPARRQIQSVSLKELGEVLSAVQGPPRAHKRAVTNSLPRRHHLSHHSRRKSNPMSPTLSPIHESGLSNPSTPRMAARPAPRQADWAPPPNSPLAAPRQN